MIFTNNNIFKAHEDLLKQNAKEVVAVARYLVCPFIYEEGFEDKRFDRYVQKAKDCIADNFLAKRYLMEGESTKDLVIDYMVSCLLLHLACHGDDSFNEEVALFLMCETPVGMCHEYVKKPYHLRIVTECEPGEDDIEELGVGYLKLVIDSFRDFKEKYEITQIVEKEFRKALLLYINKQYALDEDIDKTTYFKTLPINIIDILDIINNTINWSVIDVERVVSADSKDKELEELTDDETRTTMKENEDLKKMLKKRDEEIEHANLQIKALNKQLSEKEQERVNDIKSLMNENKSLCKKSADLQKLADSLSKKCDELTKAERTEDFIFAKELEEENKNSKVFKDANDLDVNGKYAFIISYPTQNFINRIKEFFPNSSVITDIVSLNPKNIDAVVAFSSCVTHSLYLGLKAQCKNRNIPFLHCKNMNIELAKELLSKEFSN